MKIHDPFGRQIRRAIGFDRSYEVEVEINEEIETTDLSLIGSNVSYWSETEERLMDKKSKCPSKS